MKMERILVTVSSEYFSEEAIRRAAYLAGRFKAELTLLYVIEGKVLKVIIHILLPGQSIDQAATHLFSFSPDYKINPSGLI